MSVLLQESCSSRHRPFQRFGAMAGGARPTVDAARAGQPRCASDEIVQAFHRTGGLLGGDAVADLLRRRTAQPISLLARWIVDRRVLSFAWRGEHLLPMFQFESEPWVVRRSVSAVLDEFDATFDDWDRARWFALPNGWLGDVAPVVVIQHDPDAVLQAARADRSVLRR